MPIHIPHVRSTRGLSWSFGCSRRWTCFYTFGFYGKKVTGLLKTQMVSSISPQLFPLCWIQIKSGRFGPLFDRSAFNCINCTNCICRIPCSLALCDGGWWTEILCPLLLFLLFSKKRKKMTSRSRGGEQLPLALAMNIRTPFCCYCCYCCSTTNEPDDAVCGHVSFLRCVLWYLCLCLVFPVRSSSSSLLPLLFFFFSLQVGCPSLSSSFLLSLCAPHPHLSFALIPATHTLHRLARTCIPLPFPSFSLSTHILKLNTHIHYGRPSAAVHRLDWGTLIRKAHLVGCADASNLVVITNSLLFSQVNLLSTLYFFLGCRRY